MGELEKLQNVFITFGTTAEEMKNNMKKLSCQFKTLTRVKKRKRPKLHKWLKSVKVNFEGTLLKV